MRLNLIWYVPLVAAVLVFLIAPTIVSDYQNLALIFHRFDWRVLISPSAAFFAAAVLASVGAPLALTGWTPALFPADSPTPQYRYLFSACIIVAIVAVALLIQIIIWGTFPLPVGRDGYIHVRMIPFYPCPNTPLFN